MHTLASSSQPVRSMAISLALTARLEIWRRTCIEDPAVGGWQHDTLCEDLDLSYRGQLCGWRGLFLEDVAAPAEIPPQLAAFKRQQARWAKGSIQTLGKLARPVWNSEKELSVRIAALLHLSNYLLHPALLLMLLLTLPFLLTGTWYGGDSGTAEHYIALYALALFFSTAQTASDTVVATYAISAVAGCVGHGAVAEQ